MFAILSTGFGKTLCFVNIPSIFDIPLGLKAGSIVALQLQPMHKLDAEAIINPIVDITKQIKMT